MSAPASSAAAASASRGAASGVFRLAPSGDAQLLAAGPLTFATARQASASGEAALAAAPAVREIDCSGVTSADSAGLSVLIEWLGVAKRAGRHLRYTQLPRGISSLASISEITELLQQGV
jgi:phospholipid transport system transporter-binding protein